MSARRLAVLAALASGANAGCMVCTLVGSTGGLGITVAAGPGTYRLEVHAADPVLGAPQFAETLALDFEVTAAGATCVVGPSGDCRAIGDRFVLVRVPDPHDVPRADAPLHVVIVTPGQDKLGPESATVRLFDGAGTLLAEDVTVPSYASREFNGPGCGITENAEMTITAPAP